MEDFSGDTAAHWGAAGMDEFQGGEEFVASCLAKDISGGTSGENLKNVVRIFIRDEPDELSLGECGLQSTEIVKGASLWGVDVQQDDRRLLMGESHQRTVGRLVLTQQRKAVSETNPIAKGPTCVGMRFDDGNGNSYRLDCTRHSKGAALEDF